MLSERPIKMPISDGHYFREYYFTTGRLFTLSSCVEMRLT